MVHHQSRQQRLRKQLADVDHMRSGLCCAGDACAGGPESLKGARVVAFQKHEIALADQQRTWRVHLTSDLPISKPRNQTAKPGWIAGSGVRISNSVQSHRRPGVRDRHGATIFYVLPKTDQSWS